VAVQDIEAARAGIRRSDLRFVFSAVPIQVVPIRRKTLQIGPATQLAVCRHTEVIAFLAIVGGSRASRKLSRDASRLPCI
jgi:hypothetical protein